MKLIAKIPSKGNPDRAQLQNSTATWALERLAKQQPGVLFCDPVGNGKTWEAILTAFNICLQVPVQRIALITEKSELSGKWKRELDLVEERILAKQTPSILKSVIECRRRKVVEDLTKSKHSMSQQGIWMFSPYSLNHYLEYHKGQEDLFQIIIFDECHSVKKRTKNQTYKNFVRLRQLNSRAHVLGLTATPCGKDSLDLFNLIETFCLPTGRIGDILDPEIEAIRQKAERWLTLGDIDKRSIELDLRNYLVRTPNVRERSYFLTSEGENIKVRQMKGGLPIPSPFSSEAGISKMSVEVSNLSDEEMKHLIMSQSALKVSANLIQIESSKRYSTSGLYSTMCSGFEPISKFANKLLKGKRNEHLQFTADILRSWLDKSPIHPKTHRLIEMTKNHFSLDDGDALRSKLLIYCNLVSIVKTPHLHISKEARAEARNIIIRKLKIPHGKKRALLGDKGAKLSRILRILVPEISTAKREVRDDVLLRTLRRINQAEMNENLMNPSDLRGISFVDASNQHFDDFRDHIAMSVLKNHGPDIKDEFLKCLRENLNDGVVYALNSLLKVDILEKKSRGYIYLENIFWNNHFLMWEAYKVSKNNKSDFFEAYIELVISLAGIFSSEGYRPKNNPLLHPQPPYRSLTGDVTGKDRDHLVNLFKLPMNPGILFCTKVGIEGIDLHTFCSDVVHYTLDWTPAEVEQKTGRVDRTREVPSLLKDLYKKDPRFNGPQNNHEKSNVHFLILPETYDERQLFIINQRAERERNLLASSPDLEFDGIKSGRKNCSLDLRPKKAS